MAVTVRAEACYLSTKLVAKTIDHLPSFKARGATFPKKRFNSSFGSRKGGNLSSVTCSHLGSPQPEEDHEPTIKSDWRSFRARLVASQQGSRPQESTTEEESPPIVTLGEKWAHPLHQPEKGCLLVATEKLDGVHIFERTVVLLLSTGPIGPTGIILNRPSLMSIKETRSTGLDAAGTFSERPLFFGGPLEEGLFLLNPPLGEEEGVGKSGVFEQVMKGLYYGTKESVGCAVEMVKRNVLRVGDFSFFDGYCGWEPEQLKEEVKSGYWRVVACSPTVLGLNNVGSATLWEEVLELVGEKKVW